MIDHGGGGGCVSPTVEAVSQSSNSFTRQRSMFRSSFRFLFRSSSVVPSFGHSRKALSAPATTTANKASHRTPGDDIEVGSGSGGGLSFHVSGGGSGGDGGGGDASHHELRSATDVDNASLVSKEELAFLEMYRIMDIAGQLDHCFPTFPVQSLCGEYRMWQRRSVSVMTCFCAMVLFALPAGITRFDFFLFGMERNAMMLVAEVLVIPALLAFGTYIAAQFFMSRDGMNGVPTRACAPDMPIHALWYEWVLSYRLEDVVCMVYTLSASALLLSRVLAGPCADNVTIWESQRCNPVAASHSIPHDNVLLLYAIPIANQAWMKGTTLTAVVGSYVIALSAVILCLVWVGGALQLYSVVWGLMFACVSVELERWMRLSFVRHKLVVAGRRAAVAIIRKDAELQRSYDTAQAARLAALKSEKRARAASLKEKEHSARMRESNNAQHLAKKEQEMMRHIMGNVAHDLKTPLHSIVAEVGTLRDALDQTGAEAAVPGANALAVFGAMKERTGVMLDDIIYLTVFLVMSINRSQDYVKLSANMGLRPTLETVHLSEVMRFVTKCMSHQSCGRIFVMHPPANMSRRIITDKQFLTENLLCLVSNAAKYSDRGATIDVHVHLVEAPAAGSAPAMSVAAFAGSVVSHSAPPPTDLPMVMVTVEDTGIGISDENKDVLFQPFKQAQRSAGGTGLGLFSLAGRVKALGGTCGVRDRDDGKQGSVFWFTFPYRPDETSDAGSDAVDEAGATQHSALRPVDGASPQDGAVVAPGPAGAMAPGGLPPLRFLLTDDSASILKVTKRFLERNGHVVETAENGSQSLDRLKAGYADFDVLLTDLNMPVMDGYESVKRFREWERSKSREGRLFIVGMSANVDEDTRREVAAVGMDAFVSKPFDYAKLVGALVGCGVCEELGRRRLWELAAEVERSVRSVKLG